MKQEGGIAWLALNRPEPLNAMNPKLVNEVRDFFGGLPQDTQTRVVVMRDLFVRTGFGACSPGVLREMRALLFVSAIIPPASVAPHNRALQLTWHSAYRSIRGTVWHRTRVLQ